MSVGDFKTDCTQLINHMAVKDRTRILCLLNTPKPTLYDTLQELYNIEAVMEVVSEDTIETLVQNLAKADSLQSLITRDRLNVLDPNLYYTQSIMLYLGAIKYKLNKKESIWSLLVSATCTLTHRLKSIYRTTIKR